MRCSNRQLLPAKQCPRSGTKTFQETKFHDRESSDMSVRITTKSTMGGTISTFLFGCTAILAGVSAGGCDSPTDPEPPPTGGREYVLDYNTFATEIDPILSANGCDNTSCHGGGFRGSFRLSPFDDKDVDLDFAQAALQVFAADPASSTLLMKPLDESAGGAAHAASPAHFASTNDPDYQAILAWIAAGEYR